jgi:hypothetical protein
MKAFILAVTLLVATSAGAFAQHLFDVDADATAGLDKTTRDFISSLPPFVVQPICVLGR